MFVRRQLSATLLAIALGFTPFIGAEEGAPDSAALEARKAEIASELTELKATLKARQDAVYATADLSDALAGQAKAEQALKEALASSADLLAARVAEAAAKKAYAMALSDAIAASKEMKTAQEKRQAVIDREQGIAYEQGLAVLNLEHKNSPIAQKVAQDEAVVAARQALADLKAEQDAAIAPAQELLRQAEAHRKALDAEISADDAVGAVRSASSSARSLVYALEKASETNKQYEAAKAALSAARAQAIAADRKAEDLLDDLKKLDKRLQPLKEEQAAIRAVLAVHRSEIPAGAEDAAAALMNVEEAYEAVGAGVGAKTAAAVAEAQKNYQALFDKNIPMDEYQPLLDKGQTLEAEKERQIAAIRDLNLSKALKVIAGYQALARDIKVNRSALRDIRLRFEDLSVAWHARSDAQKAHWAALQESDIMSQLAAAVEIAEAELDAKIEEAIADRPAVVEAAAALKEIAVKSDAVEFERSLINYQISHPNSPIAQRVRLATTAEAKAVSDLAKAVKAESNPALVSARETASSTRRTESLVIAAVRDANPDWKAANKAAFDAKAALASARTPEMGEALKAAEAELSAAIKMARKTHGGKFVATLEALAKERKTLNDEAKAADAAVRDVRKKLEAAPTETMSAAKADIDKAVAARKAAENSDAIKALRAAVKDAGKAITAARRAALEADAAWAEATAQSSALSKELRGVQKQLKQAQNPKPKKVEKPKKEKAKKGNEGKKAQKEKKPKESKKAEEAKKAE